MECSGDPPHEQNALQQYSRLHSIAVQVIMCVCLCVGVVVCECFILFCRRDKTDT